MKYLLSSTDDMHFEVVIKLLFKKIQKKYKSSKFSILRDYFLRLFIFDTIFGLCGTFLNNCNVLIIQLYLSLSFEK